MNSWFVPAPFDPLDLLAVMLSTLGIYAILLVCARLVGLRSFAKMSSFDFAMTVAMGSVIASTILAKDPPLLQAAVGLVSLFGLQFIVGWLRQRLGPVSHLVDNEPIVLMVGPDMIQENLAHTRVTQNDVWAKLREANVLHLDEVRAVVFETTGDISVLHAHAEDRPLQRELLTGVRDAERVPCAGDR